MFTSIVGRTFRLARRSWARTLGAYLLAVLVAALLVAVLALVERVLLGDSLRAILDGTVSSADSGRLLVFGVPIGLGMLVAHQWTQLVPIRAVSGDYDLRESLSGAVSGAWRVLALYVLLFGFVLAVLAIESSGVLLVILLLVLSVPMTGAVGQLALEPGRWGLGLLWRCGVLRAHRNIGAYAAVLVVLLLTAIVVGALCLLPIVILGGAPPSGSEELGDWIQGAALGVVIGSLLALAPAIALPAALVVAVYESLTGQVDHTRWESDEEPYQPSSELSPAVQQLVGAAPQPVRKLVIPPRATDPGRVPSPGVLNVAGVDLPAGRATRNVEAATLELAVGDGAPGEASGHDEQLWVSRDALPTTPTLWKRLAAAFPETGLWPILIPVDANSGAAVDWFEHSTRREADAVDPDEAVADRLRVRLSESLDGGSPLTSTDLLRASHVAQGELMSGRGRRTDALTFAFGAVGSARLALAPARRPADVLHALAWPGATTAGIPTDELAELVASWEERYAALLVGLSESGLVLAVLRPPSTVDEAVEVAAEHHALCPDEAVHWGTDRAAAEALVDAPVWRLTWH